MYFSYITAMSSLTYPCSSRSFKTPQSYPYPYSDVLVITLPHNPELLGEKPLLPMICLFVWSWTPLSTDLVISRQAVHLTMFPWFSRTNSHTPFFGSHWLLFNINKRWEAMEKSPEIMLPRPGIEPVAFRSRVRYATELPGWSLLPMKNDK